ncbi:MAG: HAD family hydrolase [Fervidicoccus sp.]
MTELSVIDMDREEVEALVFDYDGTLSPIGSEAGVSRELLDILNLLKNMYKLIVASTRDCRFLMEKIGFFDAFVCSNGLEAIIGDVVVHKKGVLQIERTKKLEELKKMADEECLKVEEKKSLDGKLIGLGISWRRCGEKPNCIDEIIREAIRGELVIEWYQRPFVEVYVDKAGKMEGLKIANAILNIERFAYFGDSESDLESLKNASISVFVRNSYNSHLNPPTTYTVNEGELSSFLAKKFAR